MNIKRILSIVLAIVLSISLCACGKTVDVPSSDNPTTTPSVTVPDTPENPATPVENAGFSEFDNELIAFLLLLPKIMQLFV